MAVEVVVTGIALLAERLVAIGVVVLTEIALLAKILAVAAVAVVAVRSGGCGELKEWLLF